MYQERVLDERGPQGTGSGDGPDLETISKRYPSEHPDVRAYLDVTAGGGAMTLDVDIIGIIDGKRHVLASFAQQSVAALEVITIPNCPRNISTAWVVGGTTPSMTWKVTVTRQ